MEDVQLDVQAYQLRGSAELESSQQTMRLGDNGEDTGPQARVVALPNKELDGIWESYVSLHCGIDNMLILDLQSIV